MSTNPNNQVRKLTPTQARAARRAKRSRKRRLVRLAGFFGVAMIAFLFIVALFASSLPISIGSSSGSGGVGTRFPNQGQQHIARGDEHPPYNSVPATSGWHYNAPAPWGVHAEFIKDEVLIHNLEHGGVGIHYSCEGGCPELVSKLEDIANKVTEIILSPYPNMSTTIALNAWNYQDAFNEFDEDRIEKFVRAHVNSHNAPEWQAQ